MLSLIRRNVRSREDNRDDRIRALADALILESRPSADTPESTELLLINQQALVLFLVAVFLLLLLCRYGFGWVPGKRLSESTAIYFGLRYVASIVPGEIP